MSNMLRSFKNICFLSFFVLFAFWSGTSVCHAFQAGKKSHAVYFEGQENELHVYRINGHQPGKTLLIIGGIQGDEPGGFLAADFFVDFMLEKGNLIVIPRANFMSILRKERQINQDMNRKFSNDTTQNYEAEVVEVLKKMICESDCFINLHEGSGIYSPVWVDDFRNPKRFGQSIIADASFLNSENGKARVDLEAMARKVIIRINQNIANPDHHFHFNNHRTSEPDSIHKEQLRSATYYAYSVCAIPAFGIETAKSLPLETKVSQHIYAINGFMEIMDIIPMSPAIDLKPPEMQYMIISVNDSVPVVVGCMQRLKIKRGDTIKVHDIVANYERGLSIDVIGLGSRFNDMKNKLVVQESTRIEAKKDFYKCGSVFIDVVADAPDVGKGIQVSESLPTSELKYKLRINGKVKIVENNSRVIIRKGDQVIIEDVISGNVDPADYIVNFKGFVGNARSNNGEDRGYLIDTSKDVLLERYSLNREGRQYQVLTTLNGKIVGKMFITIQRNKPSKEI